MRISITGSMSEWIDTAGRDLAAATKAGVAAATEGMKIDVRQHIAAALGTRAGNMVTARVYPESGISPRAAGVISPRRGNAEQILRSFTGGATIVGRDGVRWLAIPTKSVPGLGRGVAVTPRAVEVYFGRALRYVPPKIAGGKAGLLVLDDIVRGKNGRGYRNATKRRRAQGRRVESQVMFILVPQSRMPVKLRPEPIVERWASRVPELIERAMPKR